MRAKGINIVEADDSSKIQDAGLLFRIAFADGVYAGYIFELRARARTEEPVITHSVAEISSTRTRVATGLRCTSLTPRRMESVRPRVSR